MANRYERGDVSKSYQWLGHVGFTEVLALDARYRPGRAFVDWNREQGVFPRVGYVRGESDLLGFVDRFAGDRMVCCSLNPRGEAFRNDRGYPRSAKELEVAVSQNLLCDFDLDEM